MLPPLRLDAGLVHSFLMDCDWVGRDGGTARRSRSGAVADGKVAGAGASRAEGRRRIAIPTTGSGRPAAPSAETPEPGEVVPSPARPPRDDRPAAEARARALEALGKREPDRAAAGEKKDADAAKSGAAGKGREAEAPRKRAREEPAVTAAAEDGGHRRNRNGDAVAAKGSGAKGGKERAEEKRASAQDEGEAVQVWLSATFLLYICLCTLRSLLWNFHEEHLG